MRTPFALAALLLASPAPAQAEELFGTTPAAGAVGDGRLTAQVSWEGTITCLRWPNATFNEHVSYKTGEWDADPTRNAWLQPYYGARDNSGIFAGIRYQPAATAPVAVAWLRDAKRSFAYASKTSNRLVARYRFPNGLVVEEETFVVDGVPALVRAYNLKEVPAGATDFQILVVAHPALRNEHGKYDPRGDTDDDDQPRFASFALPASDALLTALPQSVAGALRTEVAQLTTAPASSGQVAAFVERASRTWGPGTFFVQGATAKPAGFQVGTDHALAATGPQDAFQDAQDGALSGNPIVDRFETTALAIPIVPGTPQAWYGTFGPSAGAAFAVLAAMKAKPLATWKAASDEWWVDWLRGVVLPKNADARAFSLRTLISLRTAQDPASGAIVASTSCSPPYNLDWARDGAYFQLALDLNGKFDEAEKHALFYKTVQYQEKGLYAPAGALPMNAYADGTPGGPIDFEIDEVGFMLWIFATHAAYESQGSPDRALRFLREIAASAKAAADLLVTCKDEANGLQCKANEDDDIEFTQTLQGAIAVWGGLHAAEQIFAALDEPATAARYARRAEELRRAIRAQFDLGTGKSTGVTFGALGWSFWPFPFWDASDTETIDLTRRLFTDELRQVILFAPPDPSLTIHLDDLPILVAEKTGGTSYHTKATMALMFPPLRDDASVKLVNRIHAIFLNDIVSPGTLHLAETTSYYDTNGDGVKEWVNRAATPHVWSQVELYFSLLAAEDPETFAPPAIRREASVPASGCGCGTGGGRNSLGDAMVFGIAALGLLLLRALRRRR